MSYKIYILVRTDLDMGVGKIVSQSCHGVIGLLNTPRTKEGNEIVRLWKKGGSAKIVLKVDNLKKIQDAIDATPFYEVVDEGRTVVEKGTATVMVLGPMWNDSNPKLETLLGKLKLL